MQPNKKSADKLLRDFLKYHRATPGVYELFNRFTQEVIRRGWKNYSADAVAHRIRWHKGFFRKHVSAANQFDLVAHVFGA